MLRGLIYDRNNYSRVVELEKVTEKFSNFLVQNTKLTLFGQNSPLYEFSSFNIETLEKSINNKNQSFSQCFKMKKASFIVDLSFLLILNNF